VGTLAPVIRPLLVLALVASLFPACGGGRRPDVVLIGDSLLFAAGDKVLENFDDSVVDADGEPGATVGERLGVIRRAAGRGPEGMVIELGTNDVTWDDHVPETLGDELAAALDLMADVPCVRWVEVRELNDATRTYNRMLRDAVARHPNASVVPWAALAAESDDWHDDDGVHHTDAGVEAFASMLTDAVRDCLPEPT
jgi:lysophospholipase L1-like esterase